MHQNNKQVTHYFTASIVCSAASLVLYASVFELTDPLGKFSYARFWSVFLCWLLFLISIVSAILTFRRAKQTLFRLVSIVMITFDAAGIILGVIFLVTGIYYVRLEHKVEQEERAARTNVVSLAYSEFRSNCILYTSNYTAAAEGIGHFNDIPISALRSKEVLESRRTNLANFVKAGLQFHEFFYQRPTNLYSKN